jgi:ATP-dependent DNA helicase PIF1
VHLPLQNKITLHKNTKLHNITKDPKFHKTKLTEWFETNKLHEDTRELTYCEFPRWKWDDKNRKWTKRKHGFKIGRLYL